MRDSFESGLESLQEALCYRFRDATLLRQALTHKSADRAHNELLEFLGDSVLQLLVSDWLFRSAGGTGSDEGDLTRARANLVSSAALQRAASFLQLQRYLRIGAPLGTGDLPASLLGNAFEALCAALYLDGGLEASRQALVLGLLPSAQISLSATAPALATKDPKSQLQEWLQARGVAPPRYRLLATHGPDHAPQFQVECSAPPFVALALGESSTLKGAQQAAAENLLLSLQKERG